jgi:hypothetical protein
VGDPFVADTALLDRPLREAATSAKKRQLFELPHGPALVPTMRREEALDILRALPAPRLKTDETTGLAVWGPHDAASAVTQLGRHGQPLRSAERDLLERALDHDDGMERSSSSVPPLTRRLRGLVWLWLVDLLGDAAIRHLSVELQDTALADFIVHELQRVGRAPVETVLSVAGHPNLRLHQATEYVRTRFAYDAGLAASLRGSGDAKAIRALQLGALEHDPERLRATWDGVREQLPRWRAPTAFAPLGLVPREAGVAFLVARDTRRWVRGFELELWPDFGLWTRPEHSLLSLARHDAERRLVLIVPPDDDALVVSLELAARPDRLRAAVMRAEHSEDEGRLCLPRVSRVLAPHGVVDIDWVDPEHGMGWRAGALAVHDIDRPFLLIDWDERCEEALGIGLVTGPMLLEDTLDWLGARGSTTE